MLSTTLKLLSFTYLVSATNEGSAFGDGFPELPKKRKLTLRKPASADSESAFGDVGPGETKPTASEPEEESAFGDVDYLRNVVEDTHKAPTKPTLRRKRDYEESAEEESAFGPNAFPSAHKGAAADDSSEDKELEQLPEKPSFVEESALGGGLKDDAEDDLDDADIKEAEDDKTKLALDELATDGSELEHRSEEARVSDAKDAEQCYGPQCTADKWSPVRNVHAHGPSGKPKDWKPRRVFGSGNKELMSDEPRQRGPRIYSRHQAVEHKSPEKKSLGEFMSSIMER